MNPSSNNLIKETSPSQRRGRFLVQEIEDRNEIFLPARKHRHFSTENKIFLDKSIAIEDLVNYNADYKDNECYLYDFEDNRWLDSNRIWMDTSHQIIKESDHMEIIFNYDLVNTKEDPMQGIIVNDSKICNQDPIILYYANESGEGSEKSLYN